LFILKYLKTRKLLVNNKKNDYVTRYCFISC